MKTHEEIKNGQSLYTLEETKELLRVDGYIHSTKKLYRSAWEWIQRLERDKAWASENYDLIREENKRLETQNAELVEKIKQLKRERDAAVNELKHHCWNCKYHLNKPIEETDDYGRTIHRYCSADYCFPDEENSCWEWRGPCEENGGSDA